MSERFGPVAARLGGQAALLFGWTPDTFWAATPEELATIVTAAAPPTGDGIDRNTLQSMMERERDGST